MTSAAKAQIVTCSNCGAKNRIGPARKTAAVCGRCRLPLISDAVPTTVTDQSFSEKVERCSLPVLVGFWASWCGPCRMVAPIIEELAQELSDRVRVAKLDVDANQRTAARFRVQSIPSLLIFKDGREVDRIVGSQSKQAILQRLKPLLS
ncbi:MAG: thioredoxin [Pyrinomonadaceae bacterium]